MSRRLAVGLFALLLRAQNTADPASGTAALVHARMVNLERAAQLVSFTADETATRYKSPHTNPPQWTPMDVIESEILVQGNGFGRQHMRLNGKPYNKQNFPTFTWSVDFGAELTALFDPTCHTVIEFDGPETWQGKSVLRYNFHSPLNSCFGTFIIQNGIFSKRKTYSPVWKGRFRIDDPGGNLIWFETTADGFPKDLEQTRLRRRKRGIT